ncbi:MAG: hypothetical protein LBS36_07520 [Oscillospiraceae bacterium]|jgi:hypothetical protein|nr:hypothetical protein [Oscillospiraceae bacterium]
MEGTAVPVGAFFIINGRSVQGPPLHEDCRCGLVYEENPAPAPARDFEAFNLFYQISVSSEDFISSVNGYHTAVFFLQRLSSYSEPALCSAGMAPRSTLQSKLLTLMADQDNIINAAIKRVYDSVMREAKSLKTEKGKQTRLNRTLQLILYSQVLSPKNYEYLKIIFDSNN